MNRGALLALGAIFAMFAANGETNLVSEAVRRTHVKAYSDVETAYWARGAIADKKSYVAQFADLSFDLDPFGRVGGYVWCASALATSGQSYTRRNAYNEFDYAVYYGYGLELAEDWTLETTIAKKWVVLPGYRPHVHSFSEWDVSQSLKNPYVTPYYLMRRAYHGQQWCYWEVGLTRSWKFLDDFTFTGLTYTYADWAADNGITDAWDATDALGIHNVFRYAFGKPTGAFTNPPLISISFENGQPVVRTPPLVNSEGYTFSILATDTLDGTGTSATYPLNASGKTVIDETGKTRRFFRLRAEAIISTYKE